MEDRTHLVGVVCLAFAMITGAGCGSRGITTYPVRGTVVFPDDQPVSFGRVEFYHAEHDLTSAGTIRSDGSFELGTYTDTDGAPAGNHEVVVTQLFMSGETGVTPRDHGRHVDSRYSRYETSDVELTVNADQENTFRIVVDPSE